MSSPDNALLTGIGVPGTQGQKGDPGSFMPNSGYSMIVLYLNCLSQSLQVNSDLTTIALGCNILFKCLSPETFFAGPPGPPGPQGPVGRFLKKIANDLLITLV